MGYHQMENQMKLRQAIKIMNNVSRGCYSEEQLQRATNRYNKCKSAKAAEALWQEITDFNWWSHSVCIADIVFKKSRQMGFTESVAQQILEAR